MLKLRLAVYIQVILLLLVALSLLAGFRHYGSSFDFGRIKPLADGWLSSPGSTITLPENTTASFEDVEIVPTSEPAAPPRLMGLPDGALLKDGNKTLLETAPSYVKAIMTPNDTSFSRLECPSPNSGRYHYLEKSSEGLTSSNQTEYFFTLALYQCADLLPRLLGSIVETMRFLGPQNCALSVVEGRSDDGTFEILKVLQVEMEHLGAKYFLTTNEVDPKAGDGPDRIESLSELRNQALQPLMEHPDQYAKHATVIFLNDVALCMEDILELIHQRLYQEADMTCGMDWTYLGNDPTFYDFWIARDMNGDPFFDVPESGSWDYAWNLFWANDLAKSRLTAGKPFQVFSCWNGATAFTAKPFLEQKIKFRRNYEGECYQGEPKIFAKEMWYLGYGKIAVVPTVNLEYSNEAAAKIKALKGYVSGWAGMEAADDPSRKIEWELTPPKLVKCIPNYKAQTWIAWDEALAEHEPGSWD